ncbi:MAG: hypothetical protein Crog4KO_14890 [Crocinitomicaceae bacterium]
MKTHLLIAFFAFTSFLTQAAELNYQWSSGAYYHFSAVVNDDVNTSAFGMTMSDQFTTSTDFVLQIDAVDPQGTATGKLYLVHFEVKDKTGKILASMKDIPKEAIRNDVTVDSKGIFTFPKKVYMILGSNSNVLAYGNVDENSASAGVQAGNMKVDAYAEFDPKTGKLKTGYSVQNIKNTTEVEVTVTEETQILDVIPYSFLELLALPEGDVQLNDEVKAQIGMYNVLVKAITMQDDIASLQHTISTNKNQDMFDANAQGTRGDGTQMFDMGMDTEMEVDDSDDWDDTDFDDMDMDMDDEMDMGMDLNDMQMTTTVPVTSQDQAAMDMSKGMAPDMSGDIVSNFNYAEGMFENVNGTITTKINVAGMNVEVVSKLEMRLVK